MSGWVCNLNLPATSAIYDGDIRGGGALLRAHVDNLTVSPRCLRLRLLHDARAGQAHEEAHSEQGDYLKAMVFGGLDGILTSFAIVAGAAGM